MHAVQTLLQKLFIFAFSLVLRIRSAAASAKEPDSGVVLTSIPERYIRELWNDVYGADWLASISKGLLREEVNIEDLMMIVRGPRDGKPKAKPGQAITDVQEVILRHILRVRIVADGTFSYKTQMLSSGELASPMAFHVDAKGQKTPDPVGLALAEEALGLLEEPNGHIEFLALELLLTSWGINVHMQAEEADNPGLDVTEAFVGKDFVSRTSLFAQGVISHHYQIALGMKGPWKSAAMLVLASERLLEILHGPDVDGDYENLLYAEHLSWVHDSCIALYLMRDLFGKGERHTAPVSSAQLTALPAGELQEVVD